MGAPAPDDRQPVRDALVVSLEGHLRYARLEMLVIVVATGLVGFAVSAGLLHGGVSSMARRYSVATIAAYAAFLLLVRLGAEHRLRHIGAWTPPPEAFRARPRPPERPRPIGHSLRPWGSQLLAELLSPFDFVALVVAGAALAVVVYSVWTAPVLLAEVLLDVVLVAGLYRRLSSVEPQSWLRTAVRRTWKTAVIVVVLVATIGFVVQRAMPGIDSIGDVFRPEARSGR